MSRLTIVVMLLVASVTGAAAAPVEPDPGSRTYCGLYAVYAIFRYYGVDVDFSELTTPRYCSNVRGSSLRELELAVSDRGLKAAPLVRMTVTSLRVASSPAVLHTRTELDSSQFNHYVAYLGTDRKGQPIIVDGGRRRNWGWGELSAHWSGTGMFVAREPPSKLLQGYAALWAFSPILLALGAVFAAGTLIRRRSTRPPDAANHPKSRAMLQECVKLAVIAVGLATLVHWLRIDGFVRDPHAISQIHEASKWRYLPEVRAEHIKTAMPRGAVVIDTNAPTDYRRQHIPGSVNIPVGVSTAQLANLVAGWERNKELIVYCTGDHCTSSDHVARSLMKEGFTNVKIYRAGWEDWKARGLEIQSAEPTR